MPRLAILAAVLGFLFDAPHLLFDSDAAVASDHPLFIFHGVMGIATIAVLALVLGGLLIRADGRTTGRLPTVAALVTLAGLFLAGGGTWGEGFMVPHLADIDPTVFADDISGYLLGVIILGGVLLSVGWLLMAVVLRRAGLLTKGSAIILGVAAVIAIAPFLLTSFLLTLAIAVVAQRLYGVDDAQAEQPVLATA